MTCSLRAGLRWTLAWTRACVEGQFSSTPLGARAPPNGYIACTAVPNNAGAYCCAAKATPKLPPSATAPPPCLAVQAPPLATLQCSGFDFICCKGAAIPSTAQCWQEADAAGVIAETLVDPSAACIGTTKADACEDVQLSLTASANAAGGVLTSLKSTIHPHFCCSVFGTPLGLTAAQLAAQRRRQPAARLVACRPAGQAPAAPPTPTSTSATATPARPTSRSPQVLRQQQPGCRRRRVPGPGE
jgi:hypothetical protein